MSHRIRSLARPEDPDVERLLDAAFHRTGRESRVALELSRAHPSFDPELALVAEREGRALGCAVLLPRTVLLRGAPVPVVVCGPVGVEQSARDRGLGSELLRAALGRAATRGALGAVGLGAPEFFGRLGFASAFDLSGLRVPAEILPPQGPSDAWRGLRAEDLPALSELALASHREVSGAELRTADALDWESLAPRAHTLVHPGPGRPLAYLRFRVRDELEILECGVQDPAGVAAVLALMRRLAGEHARLVLLARLPEPHPVARALFHRGALLERSHLGGAAMLAVLDWPGLLQGLAPAWKPALLGLESPAFSLGVGADAWRLELGAAGPSVAPGRCEEAHLALPAELAPAFLTGQRGFEELWFEPAVREASTLPDPLRGRLSAFLGPRAALWGYAPLFELMDD